jgi:ABC-type phosphate transport system substrate-binding protein
MKKTLAPLAWAAIPALLLSISACNGNATGGSGLTPTSNAPAASQHGRVHRKIFSTTALYAGGATFPAYGYNDGAQPVGTPGPGQATPGPGSILASYGGTGTIYYCLTGSGFGRSTFEAGNTNGQSTAACAALGATPTGFGAAVDPPDFAGSDVAMPSTECCASGTTYATNRASTYGQPFEIPTFGGPIVFATNALGFSVSPIKLSTWTYCAIANGTVTNWNDAAITADNAGHSVTGGTSESITFYFRSDKSGTTYLFTNKLNDSHSGCNQSFGAPYNTTPYASGSRSAAWTFGVNQLWPGPSSGNFVGASGNPGVLAGIQSGEFATGYVEGAWAASASPGTYGAIKQAWLLNQVSGKFVDPTNAAAVAKSLSAVKGSSITYGGGSDGSPLQSSTPNCQLYISPSVFVTPTNAKAYPIVGLSYWLFYGTNLGVHTADKTTLVKYIASNAANSVLSHYEYTPLVTGVHNQILKALNGHGRVASCLQ